MSVNWVGYALLSAVFAGLTALLAKMGVANVPSNLAMFIRTMVVVLFAGGIAIATGDVGYFGKLSSRNWIFLVLSGIATGLSWIFYFAALKYGPVSRVAAIDKLSFVLAMALGVFVLGESVKPVTLAGALLIVAGVLLTLR